MSKYDGVSRNSNCPCGSGKRFKYCHGSNEVNSAQKVSMDIHNSEINNELFSADVYFCIPKGKFYTIDETQLLFVADDTNEKIQLDQLSHSVFHDLAVFDNYENHFLRCSRLTGIQKHQFRSLIETLVQNNLLLMASDVVSSLKLASNHNKSCLAGIAIRTCESSNYLERILQSQIRRKQKFNANEKIYIFDNSSSNQSIQANELIIKEASKTLDITYCGLEWQESFAENLISQFPDVQEIKELLLPPDDTAVSGKRISNLELLFFAGKRFLHFNDDFILDDARLHHTNTEEYKRVHIATKFNVYDVFNDKQVMMKCGVKLSSDPLLYHKKALGMTLGEFIKDRDDLKFDEKSLIGMSVSDIERFNSDSTIVTTGNGKVGTFDNQDDRLLFQTDYEQTLSGRYCWPSSLKNEFIEKCSSTPSGINNTHLLPPTLLSCNSQDIILSTLISAIYPNSIHLNFPWALGYFNSIEDWDASKFQEANPLQLNDIVNSITTEISLPSEASNIDRIEYIVASMERLTDLSDDEFLSQLRKIYISSAAAEIEIMQQRLPFIESIKSKDIVKNKIKSEISQLYKQELPHIENAIGNSELQQVQWLKRELDNYSKLLKDWPKLWEFSKLNAEKKP